MEDEILKELRAQEESVKYNDIRNNLAIQEKTGLKYGNMFETFEERDIKGYDTSSMFLNPWDDPRDFDELQEKKAQRQPGWVKLVAGVPRVATKAITEVIKIIPTAGGLAAGTAGQVSDWWTGEDNTDFMTVAFDNAWIRALNDANEWVNNEILPVYVRKAVSEGSLWDNITSPEFYATDGADGLGYIISMLAPGGILKWLNLGSKVFRTAGNISKISKGMKFSDEALTNMQKMAKLGLPTNAKNFDLYSQTIANTILEAGVESQQAGQQYEEENLWRTELTPDDPDYMSLEELNQNKSNIMANIFKGNAAVLIGPNAVMSKMLWGGTRNSTRGLRNFKFEDGAIKQIEKKGALETVNEIGQEFGKAFGREGAWEEVMQGATSDYFSANPKAGFLSSIGEIPKAYVNTITSVEGQKALYLGGAFGGGMQNITNYIHSKKEKENTNKLISYANSKLDNYWKTFEGDIYKKDENGKVIEDENGRSELDEKEAIERLQRLNQLEQLSDVYDQALADGNGELAAQLRNEATISLIEPFLNNERLGLEALNQYLQTAPGVETMAQNEGVSKESIISDIMDKARSLEMANQTFDNFSDSILDVKNEKATKEDKQTFFQGLRSRYFAIKARRHFVNKRLESLNNQLDNLLKEKGRTREEYDNNGKLAIELDNTDARFESINDKINNYKKLEEELTNIENDFWNKKAVQKEYDSKVNLWATIREEKEAKEKEISDTIDKINNAATEEELDDISKTNTFADKVINDAIVKKRQELQAEKEAKKQEQTDSQKKKSEENKKANDKKQEEKEDLGDKIDGYNVGEEFSLTKAELSPYLKDLDQDEYTGIIESDENNTEDSVTIRIQETGEEITIPKKVSKPQPTNLEQEFGTEGSEDHDKNIPKDNENEENTSDSAAKTGTLVLSTNKKTGEKLFDDISDDYLDYEKDPRNKIGHTVHFEVNNKVSNNKNWTTALEYYQKILRDEKLSKEEIDFLINHLPINAVFSTSKELSKTPKSPINTLPSVKGKSQDIFNKTSKVLRTHLINHLNNGGKIEEFTTTIEGQYGGMLKVDLPDADNNVRKNNILDLYHFKGMSTKEKIAYIRKNIAIVDQQSNFEFLNGDKVPFINKKGQTKEKAKGDVYLMIPKANGVMFPLKLNIKRLDNNSQNDTIADIYEAVLKNEKLGKTSTLDELDNKELEQKIKNTFQEEKKLIGKPWNDITIGDILDFMIFDKSTSLKSRIGFLNDKNHNEFTYGDPSDGGMVINSAEEFNKDHFKKWLENNKRQHIRFKGKKGQDSKADMKANDAYIQYLIENRALSTNAVVGENTPTFQGYSNIYLDSENVNGNVQPSANQKTVETKDRYRDAINSVKQDKNGNWTAEYERADGIVQQIEGKDERDILRQINKLRNNELKSEPKKINSLTEAVPTVSNQKADIGRRRQEISEEGLQELNEGNQTDSEIESQPTGFFKSVWGYLRGKYSGNIDNLIDIVANPSDYLLDLNKVLSGVKISKIGKAYSTFINELEKQTNLLNGKLEERVNKGIRENYPQSSMDKLIKERDEKIAKNNEILQKAKEINAKYDAELDALEKPQKEDRSPFNKAKDGDNLYSVTVNYKTYFASENTRKVYESTGKQPGRGQATLPIEQMVGALVTDNNIISQVENEIKADDLFGNPEIKLNTYSTVENNTNNIRNSQNNFVSSHEVPNTASNAAVTTLKDNTKVKDKIEASDELIKELTKFIVIEKKALKVGSEAWKVFSNKSNQEKFDILKDIADTWNFNIDNIITKCK